MNVKLLDFQAQYSSIRGEIRRVIDEVCDLQAFILGATVDKFEKNLAAYCQTRYAVGLSSGTDAILCALMAIGVGSGDEVICPSFTFFATAGCVARLGARPVFVDIEAGTMNIDPAKVEAAITGRTKAIIPVHLFGQMARMEEINAVAAKYGVVVIEDAAQAIGARRHDKPACAHGLIGCLSFYPTKNLGAFGDAGAICTNDEALAERCRKIRVHGSGHTYYHEVIGGNFRLDALQAAVLDVKLKYLNGWHEGRRRNAVIYDEMFKGTAIRPQLIEEGNWSIYNQYTVRVPGRDRVKAALVERGIGSAIYYPLPLHLQQCFAYLGQGAGTLPHTERACAEVLSLPVYPELPEEQVRHVATQMLEIVKG